jgi:hypothetical protein
MATVSPVLSRTAEGIPYLLWENVATGDTITAYAVHGRLATNASVQFTGTFGGATVKLQTSNDGTTYADIKDVHGTTVSATAAGQFEFSRSAVYLRPAISGGTSDAVDIYLVLRGPASSV